MKYISFYDTDFNKNEQRYVSFAAKTKIDYIISQLLGLSEHIQIISPSGTKSSKIYKGNIIKINEKLSLKLFLTIGTKHTVIRRINSLINMVSFIIYLLFHTSRNEPIILYHSLYFIRYKRFFYIIKKIKKSKLILDIEEIYSDVLNDLETKKKEMKFFQCADAYIFPTKLLNEQINVNNKQSVFIHGTYQVEPDYNCKFNDGKIHVVYAGTFDPRKGGAVAAVTTAEFLNEHYHMHIIGFGSENEVKQIQDLIKKVSDKTKCTISFDGLKTGEEYIRFIQSCDIGLSTQNPDAAFNATSFPSKILSYLANGLRVVSIRIPVVEQSDIGDIMYYYDEQTPEKIAQAILKIDMDSNYDSRKRICELSDKFEKDIEKLFQEAI